MACPDDRRGVSPAATPARPAPARPAPAPAEADGDAPAPAEAHGDAPAAAPTPAAPVRAPAPAAPIGGPAPRPAAVPIPPPPIPAPPAHRSPETTVAPAAAVPRPAVSVFVGVVSFAVVVIVATGRPPIGERLAFVEGRGGRAVRIGQTDADTVPQTDTGLDGKVCVGLGVDEGGSYDERCGQRKTGGGYLAHDYLPDGCSPHPLGAEHVPVGTIQRKPAPTLKSPGAVRGSQGVRCPDPRTSRRGFLDTRTPRRKARAAAEGTGVGARKRSAIRLGEAS
jgi:hypothetical protein